MDLRIDITVISMYLPVFLLDLSKVYTFENMFSAFLTHIIIMIHVFVYQTIVIYVVTKLYSYKPNRARYSMTDVQRVRCSKLPREGRRGGFGCLGRLSR